MSSADATPLRNQQAVLLAARPSRRSTPAILPNQPADTRRPALSSFLKGLRDGGKLQRIERPAHVKERFQP
jgi:hypothetical protein